ncbi:MAG: methylated-DNA--[protein]-cysteine S-methyltransferase [Dehalococcoidia bacterium]
MRQTQQTKAKQIKLQRHRTEMGELTMGSFDGALCFLGVGGGDLSHVADDRLRKGLGAVLVEEDSPILELTRRQIDEYLGGTRKEFDIPLLMVGSDFQKSVWKALMKVPHGSTSTYRRIAEDIGSPKAVRAVGNACKANPIGIIVPCHRIIGSDGGLVGYGGGVPLKEMLLSLEQRHGAR